MLASAKREVIVPLLRHIPGELKAVGLRSRRVLWDDRGWPARLGLIGVTVGATAFGGKAAGLATMGRGVAVPLWVVFGASGTFLGTLLDELAPSRPTTTYSVIDAERTPARASHRPGSSRP